MHQLVQRFTPSLRALIDGDVKQVGVPEPSSRCDSVSVEIAANRSVDDIKAALSRFNYFQEMKSMEDRYCKLDDPVDDHHWSAPDDIVMEARMLS